MKKDILQLMEMLGFKAGEPKQVRQAMYYPYYFEMQYGQGKVLSCSIVIEDDDDTEDVTRKILIESKQKEREEMQKELKKLIGVGGY